MITEIKGDLFNSGAYVLVHGCNCQGVMGSGVARQIRNRYPDAYGAYRKIYEEAGELELGSIMPITTNGKIIINAMTQRYYGFTGQVYVDYNAVRSCVQVLSKYLKGLGISSENEFQLNVFGMNSKIAMPRIGCGLANGRWKIIKPIIEEELQDYNVEVYYL